MLLRTFSLLLYLSGACYSLNCTNERAGNCYCSKTHQYAKYELYCPSYTPQEKKITMKVEPGKFVYLTCSRGVTILEIMTSMEGLEIGDIKIIKILNCPVPADPLATLFVKMGIKNLTNIEMLEFSQAQRSRDASQLQGYHFKNLSNLILLELPRNRIKKIDETFFTEILKLQVLDLTMNRGIQIDGNSFQNLEKLEEFRCHSCTIQSFDENIFKSLENLKKLSLHDNRLSSLPSGIFGHLKNLLNLNLAKNQLKELPPRIFNSLENMTDIMLSYNQFRSFPENLFKMNKNLKTFIMLANGECLPFMGCSEDRMKKLVLPETMFHESTIEEIKMLWVPIETIPKTFFKGCTNLVNLTIQNSFIKELPRELFTDTKKLKLIDLSGNNIETLPSGLFDQLSEVESLRFLKNRLSQLHPNQFVDLGNLKIAHFQENAFEYLPYELFSQTKKLEELDLSYNKLNMSHHKRFTSGTTFDKLRIFNISHNQLTFIPDEFRNDMLNAQVINMSHNQIRGSIEPGDIQFWQRKRVLIDLSFNSIERVILHEPGHFSLQENNFNNFKLSLTGNPFICDCITTELKQKMEGSLQGVFHDMFDLTSTDLTCGDKSSLQTKGRLLSDVPFADLNCPFPSTIIPQNCTDNCSCNLNRYYRETLIDCSNRSMTTFPSNIILMKDSDSIRLNMEHNQIRNLKKAVEKYYKTAFTNYRNITSLYLSNNIISSFHHKCLPPDLKELFLDNNRITSFEQTDIDYFINRTNLELKLGNNLYGCDCKSEALYYFVKNGGSQIKDKNLVELNCEDSKEMTQESFDALCWNRPPATTVAVVSILVIFLLIICLGLAAYACFRETIITWIHSKSQTDKPSCTQHEKMQQVLSK